MNPHIPTNMSQKEIPLCAENCTPPLGHSDEVIAYLKGLQPGERVVECGTSGMTGRLGTVYISVKTGPGPIPTPASDTRTVCVRWDEVVGEGGQMSTSVTGGSRRLEDAGTFSHLDDPEEPGASDGCDKDGFPRGCVRAGHTPENCPGFQVGDTVRFSERHQAAGDIGVIVAMEVWLNDNEAVPWDGCGCPPAFSGTPPTVVNAPRFLVRLTELGTQMIDSLDSVNSWRERCRQYPHSYPYCWDRDLKLVSRPEIKVLNDSGELGSTLGFDREAKLSCISDSEAGARKVIADMKAANGISLRYPKREPGEPINFRCQEVTETKVDAIQRLNFTGAEEEVAK